MEKKTTPGGVFDGIWDFFISVKLTVVLLLCLAGTSVIGTLIPQNENPAVYFRQFGEFFYKLFSVLDIFDMYHSWWFQMLLVMLLINIIACSINRLSKMWKVIFNKNPAVNPSRFKKLENRIEKTSLESCDDLYHQYPDIIAKRFSFLKKEKTETGFYIYAEKGRLARLGVYVVHLSVLFLLIGGLIGSKFGFEGFANIPEGESVDHVQLRQSRRTLPLGFAIRCEDFAVSFYKNGAPKEFRSRLTIIEEGKNVLTRDIIVNKPLRYKGINIFQSSYGQIPVEKHPVVDLASKKIRLTITNRQTGMAYNKELSIGDSAELPEGQGIFLIKEYKKDASFRGQNIGEALLGIIMMKEKDPVEVLLPLRYPNFDKMRGGDFFFSLENIDDLLTADDTQPLYYTGLQITKDPGVRVVYAGFLLMIIGCYVSFFIAHQQFFIEVTGAGKKTRVLVAGTTNKNKIGMDQKLKTLSDLL